MHINISNNFAVTHRVTQHTQVNMVNTLDGLQAKIRKHNCHTHRPSSTITLEAPNMLIVGLTELMLSKTQQEDNAEGAEIGVVIEEDNFDAF